MVLISSSFDSRSGFTALGSGAAPEEEDLSEEGMISSCKQAQYIGDTLCRNHEISRNHIDTLRVDEKLIGATVYLRIPSLDCIQGRFSTQCLRLVSLQERHTRRSAPP